MEHYIPFLQICAIVAPSNWNVLPSCLWGKIYYCNSIAFEQEKYNNLQRQIQEFTNTEKYSNFVEQWKS